jgi:hypothetical protein
MHEYEKLALKQAINERMNEIRPRVHFAIAEAQEQVSEGRVLVRDGFSGLRYVSRVLWREMDINFVRSVDAATLYDLLIEAAAGAARYRLKKLHEAHKPQAKEKRAKKQ